MSGSGEVLTASLQSTGALVWVIGSEHVAEVLTRRGEVLVHLTDPGKAGQVAEDLDLSKVTDYPESKTPFTTYKGICSGVTITLFGALREDAK